jgi:hypothetical protein
MAQIGKKERREKSKRVSSELERLNTPEKSENNQRESARRGTDQCRTIQPEKSVYPATAQSSLEEIHLEQSNATTPLRQSTSKLPALGHSMMEAMFVSSQSFLSLVPLGLKRALICVSTISLREFQSG